MGKQRMTAVDLAVEARDLHRTLLGLKVANIYDLNARTYILKFSGAPKGKILLLIESGIRIHSTLFERGTSPVPHGFTQKLRKHVRKRRVENVEQLGVDRVIDIRFGSGEGAVHLISEFYAAGNIVLTDGNYEILAILRSAKQDKRVFLDVGDQYDVSKTRQKPELSLDLVKECLDGMDKFTKSVKHWFITRLWHGSDVVEHCLIEAGINTTLKASEFPIDDDSPQLSLFLESLRATEHALFESETNSAGYITIGEWDKKLPTPEDGEQIVYDTFSPFLFKQLRELDYKQFETFDEAMDTFYSHLEAQRELIRRCKEEQAVSRMMEKVKSSQVAHLEELASMKVKREQQAHLIESNLDGIERATLVIRSHLASGMDWTEIGRVVEEARLDGDPVASLIKDLRLSENHMTVSLIRDEDDEFLDVDIDLALSAHANARNYYDQVKKTDMKHKKTLEHAESVIQTAEHKAVAQLKETKTTSSIRLMRKKHWFEKFLWFISSENHLIVSGRDAQQNEILVKKYLGKGDIYVHADLHGATSCIVKNNQIDKPISPVTLMQAGIYSVCRSAAWKSKIVTSSWWVNPDQVSKTAPTGEYLPTGSFVIRGKKNFLPPHPLQMGLAVLFRPDESCLAAHVDERVPRVDIEETASYYQHDDRVTHDYTDDKPTMSRPDSPEEKWPHDRYNLNDDDEAEKEEEEAPVKREAGSTRRYMTAKERRDMKRAKSGKPPPVQQQPKKEKVPSEPPVVLKRGKKSKLKRFKKKYADQDDEDRAAAMALVGSIGLPREISDSMTSVTSSVTSTAAEEVEEVVEEVVTVPEAVTCYRCGQTGHRVKDCPQPPPEEDDDDLYLPDEDRAQLSDLDLLTGTPLPDDSLIYAVAVCAPYSALQTYKYKVKLQPGSTKKGKATRAAAQAFIKNSIFASTPLERDLIKAIPESEWVAVTIADVKVVVPSDASKKGKKKGKR